MAEKQSFENWQSSEQTFLQRRHKNGQQVYEKCLMTWKIKIKTTMKYYLIPIKVAIIKKTKDIKFGESIEKRVLQHTAGWNVDGCSHYRKQYGGF